MPGLSNVDGIEEAGRSEKDYVFSKLEDRFSVPLQAREIEVV